MPLLQIPKSVFGSKHEWYQEKIYELTGAAMQGLCANHRIDVNSINELATMVAIRTMIDLYGPLPAE